MSVFIIALLAGLFLANYHAGQKSSKLQLAAQEIASNIRQAQNNSLGLREFNGSQPEGGWGIYLSPGTPNYYIIFADVDNDHSYDINEKYQQINLPTGISVQQIFLNNSSVSQLNIVFEPPLPKVYLNGQENSQTSIFLGDGEHSKQIFINFFGLVEVQ